ncbi:dihydroorotase [Gammaproteobacteria bacterium 53_120_T64]|nr:dihydroorotase [Gammaproteobacteria bacterium 53_120_T64]
MPSPTDQLTITQPDDWHLHLRDGAALTDTVRDASRHFARAIVMPNLAPPVITTEQAGAYRQRILEARHEGSTWQPLMVLYLTDNTPADEIDRALASGFVHAAKYYPAGATTNSDSGVTAIEKIFPVLERMQQLGLPLLLHGEVTDTHIDIFDREAVFIERTLTPLCAQFPELKIVLEHITTAQGADFVSNSGANIAATITPQHLLFNRNDLLAGGIRPHNYCLPILKRSSHQQALIEAATSGSAKFFLGTDSAPHPQNKKESACGCAGCYSHHAAIELYAEVFERAGALDKLEGFASHFGPAYYGLPVNQQTITLRRAPWQLPATTQLGKDTMVPFYASQTLQWAVVDGE